VTYTGTIVTGTWNVTVSHEIFSNEFKIDGTASFTVEGAPGIFLYAGSVSLGYYTGVANYWAAVVNALFRCSSREVSDRRQYLIVWVPVKRFMLRLQTT